MKKKETIQTLPYINFSLVIFLLRGLCIYLNYCTVSTDKHWFYLDVDRKKNETIPDEIGIYFRISSNQFINSNVLSYRKSTKRDETCYRLKLYMITHIIHY